MSKQNVNNKKISMAVDIGTTIDKDWSKKENIVVIQNVIKTNFLEEFLKWFFLALWWLLATLIVLSILVSIWVYILKPYIEKFLS